MTLLLQSAIPTTDILFFKRLHLFTHLKSSLQYKNFSTKFIIIKLEVNIANAQIQCNLHKIPGRMGMSLSLLCCLLASRLHLSLFLHEETQL